VQGLLDSDTSIHLSDFRIEAISGGADALAEVVIGVEDDRGRRVAARSAREDIVMASVEALISAINRLMLLNSGNEKA
jgi:2-isopropylmalate synthase